MAAAIYGEPYAAGMVPSGGRRGYADLARQILSAPSRLGGVRLVCVDGPTCSGKTTLARRLVQALGAERQGPDLPSRVEVLHMDDLYEGWDGLPTVADRLDDWILRPLRAGRPGRYRRFDWTRNAYAEWHDVLAEGADGVLVVEGVGSASRGVDGSAVLRIWLEAPDETRLARATARDGGAFGPYWDAWAKAESEHFATHRTKERADIVLDGASPVDHDQETEVVVTSWRSSAAPV